MEAYLPTSPYIANITSNVSNTNSNLANLSTALTSTNSNVANLSTALTSTNSNVANLSTALTSTNSNVANLVIITTDTSSDVANLTSSLSNTDSSVANTNSNVANLTIALTNTDSNVANVASNVTTLQSQVYTNSNAVSLLASFGSNTVSTTGNITASYFVGNGSQLTDVVSRVPTVYLTAAANGNAQTFSNVILSNYTSNVDMTVFLNGALLENTNYTLADDVITVNTYLRTGDNIDVITTLAGNINNVTSGYGNSNVAAYLTGYNGNLRAGNIVANSMTINGNVFITGNANIQGTLTYNDVTNITTANLVLGLGNTQTGINVNGGGIVVGNTNEASFLYNFSSQSWDSNIGIAAPDITTSALVVNSTEIGLGGTRDPQGLFAVAVGYEAGSEVQSQETVAVGYQSGYSAQGLYGVAVGPRAGYAAQNTSAVAVGPSSGYDRQGNSAIAIGDSAGYSTQGANAVAIGTAAGDVNQGDNTIAVGLAAGSLNQGDNSIAIGAYAGNTSQANNSIIINASGNGLNSTNQGLYVSPVRNDTANVTNGLYYNPATKELTYSNSVRSSGQQTVPYGVEIVTAGNAIDVTTFTLPAAGKYLVTYAVRVGVAASGHYGTIFLTNSSNNVLQYSEVLTPFLYGATFSDFQTTNTGTYVITAPAAGTYKVRLRANVGSVRWISDGGGAGQVSWTQISV